MLKKLDNIWVGLAIGFFTPPITFYIIFLNLTKTLRFTEFLSKIKLHGLAVNTFIWTIIPIFAFFAFYYFMKYDKGAKGLVIPTMIYTIALVIYDF